MEPLAFTTAQEFEIERMNRVLDAATDPAELRAVCKQLLKAWQIQKAATSWMMRQAMGSPWQPKSPRATHITESDQ